MRRIAYVRVSLQDQNQERQIKQLNEIGMDMIYQEKVSESTINREQLQKMLNELKTGDTIYVTDLTRIKGSTKDLFPLIDCIKSKNASLKSLNLSKDNSYSQFLITVMAGVNQLERDLIKMRQREGIEIEKKRVNLKVG